VVALPGWGRVVATDGEVGWRVVDPGGRVVVPVAQFLRDFAARGNRPGSVRSYAFALLRWWRWLQVVDVGWDQVTSVEVRDFVLWFGQARKAPRAPRTVSLSTAGTVNSVTGKRYLGDGFEPRTVRHSNAVLRCFYEYWIELGEGPLVNPVALARKGGRGNAHHDPLEPFRGDGRLRYNPKLARRRPRAIPDERWNELFAGLGSHRDRAIAAFAVSNGARASELLGVRGVDLDWGEQLVRVTRKGAGVQQWLPASPEAFVWLRLYLAELGELGPNEPVWWTLRRRDHGHGLCRQPLNYEALRAVFRRVNALLATNYSMHDLRHTAALRMSRDERLSMRDVQTVLGHAHLSTTADVYLVEDDAQVLGRVHRHLAERAQQLRAAEPPAVGAGYDAADLSILFGTRR
jgi:integrase